MGAKELMRTWVDRFVALERRYFAVDGGSGAAIFAALPGLDDRVRPVDSPRHADTIVIAAPVSEALLSAVVDVWENCPLPRRAVVVDATTRSETTALPGVSRLEEHMSISRRVVVAPQATDAARAVADAILALERSDVDVTSDRQPEELLVDIRDASEREIGTEDVVVSVGPVQDATAGPLQMLLLMDGEQVVRADVRSGFASRGLLDRLRTSSWSDGAVLAASLDPLAPVTGRLTFVRALEQLHGIEPPEEARYMREVALRVERASSHLTWLVRFARLLAYDALTAAARRAALAAVRVSAPPGCIVPGGWGSTVEWRPDARALKELATETRRLASRVRSDRLFALRTRAVGAVTPERARAVGASGPLLRASTRAPGDARARALVRLDAAAEDLFEAAARATRPLAAPDPRTLPGVPPSGVGRAGVKGPRGTVTLALRSAAGPQPADVEWSPPSRAHLGLVADIVTGLTLPDALAAVASLDLSMAEADG